MGNVHKTLSKSKAFLGLCNYYRNFVNGFAKIAAPLTDLTKKKNPFKWESRKEIPLPSLNVL